MDAGGVGGHNRKERGLEFRVVLISVAALAMASFSGATYTLPLRGKSSGKSGHRGNYAIAT